MNSAFMDAMEGYDAVSFDVYDTLVVRPYVSPVDVFLHMERIHGAEGFARLREDAEEDVRRRVRGEITLEQVYDALDPRFRHLMDAEVELESRITVANPETVGMMRAALDSGRRVFLISDMYLSSEVIEGMLHRCGITGYHAFYVSTEHGATKHEGSLFRKVSEEQGVPLDRILHVGDNRRGDQSVPRSLGMGVFPYERPIDVHLGSHNGFRRYLRSGDRLSRSIILSIDMMLERGMIGTTDGDLWFRLGRRFGGPIIHSYAKYVAENVDPDARLLFASRDGYSVRRVFSDMMPDHDDTAYVHVQRIFSYVLTDSTIPRGRMDLPNRRTDRFEHGKVVSRVRYLLGFFSDDLGLDSIPDDPDEAVRLYNDNADLLDSLRDERSRDYSQYIRDVCAGAEDVELVDCTTMKYTSQRLVEGILGRPIRGHYFVTLADSDLGHDTYHVRRGFQFDWGYINIPEFFMCSPELPIKGWSSGSPVFNVDSPGWEMHRAEVFGDISDGECEYSSLVRGIFGDSCPMFDYQSVVKWSAMSAWMGNEYSRAIRSMKWASGPSHKDWFPIVPNDLRDILFVVRRLVTDLVSRMNEK